MKQFKFLFSLVLVAIASAAIGTLFNLPIGAVAGTLAVASFVKPTQSGVLNDVIVETWRPYIIERFWKDNAFLSFVSDASDSVLQGRIVHIPQPGAKPTVVKNRSSFPAAAARRADTDIVYALDEYTTDPTHIPNIDAVHLSYSKQDSVLGDHMQVLNELVADDLLIKWASSTNVPIIRTTGAAIAPVSGQTGNRKGFGHADLKKLMIRFNTDGVPKSERYIIIDDNMYEFFYDSLSDTQSKDFSRYIDAENGVIGKLHSFNIMTRASVVASTNADAIKALGAALAATDHLASFAWQKQCLEFAMGDVKLFEDKNNPQYYGDIYSTLVMAGGRTKRADGKGVVVIRQDNAA